MSVSFSLCWSSLCKPTQARTMQNHLCNKNTVNGLLLCDITSTYSTQRYVTFSNKTRHTNYQKNKFSDLLMLKMLNIFLNDVLRVIFAQSFTHEKINIGLKDSFVFYWFVTCLLACIAKMFWLLAVDFVVVGHAEPVIWTHKLQTSTVSNGQHSGASSKISLVSSGSWHFYIALLQTDEDVCIEPCAENMGVPRNSQGLASHKI